MPDSKQLDPTGERAEATEAMESTPISGKEHEYRADGDHRPRQNVEEVADGRADAAGASRPTQGTAPEPGVEAKRHISEGIPGAGRSADADAAPGAPQERGPRE